MTGSFVDIQLRKYAVQIHESVFEVIIHRVDAILIHTDMDLVEDIVLGLELPT